MESSTLAGTQLIFHKDNVSRAKFIWIMQSRGLSEDKDKQNENC